MEDVEFSLVKKKIIKTNDVIRILSEKNYNLNRIIDKLKILYFKYREKSNEAYALRTALEMCKLELEPLKIDYTALLSKYLALEEEHKYFVNNSEVKYQKVCADLDDINQKYNLVTLRKLEHCTSCTTQIERNTSLSKEVKSLKMQILQNNDRLSADLNTFTENHAKEVEALKMRHVMEMQRIENRYTQELDTSNSRLKYLEAREKKLNEENNVLQKKLLDIKPSNITVSITHLAECDLKQDSSDLDNDVKYLPKLLSPISGDKMESDMYEMEIDAEIDRKSEKEQKKLLDIKPSNITVSITHLDECDLQQDSSDLDDNVIYKYVCECKYLPKLLSPISGDKMESDMYEMEIDAEIERKSEKETEMSKSTRKSPIDDNIDETRENNHSNTADIQTRYALRRKTLKAKQDRHKKLKKNILRSLFKYIDRRLVEAKSRALAEHNRKCTKQNMSQSYKNKRKLQMMRWKYLREVCFSSTDSEHDSRLVWHTARKRKKEKNRVDKENLMKLIRRVNGHYDDLTSGFDDLSKYYHTLNLHDSNISEKIDTGDSGYSGRSDPEFSLADIAERVPLQSTIDDSCNNLSSHRDDTKFGSGNLEILEIAIVANEEETNDDQQNDADVKLRRSPRKTVRTIGVENLLRRMKKNLKECKRGEITLDRDVSSQYCGKKRISHCNNVKPVGHERQEENSNTVNEDNRQSSSSINLIGKRVDKPNVNVCEVINSVNPEFKIPIETSSNHASTLNTNSASIKLKEEVADVKSNIDEVNRGNSEVHSKIGTPSNGSTAYHNNNCSSIKLTGKRTVKIGKSNVDQVPNPSSRHLSTVHLKKLITFPEESTIFAEVVSALSTMNADSIISSVLEEVSIDTNSKPDKQYTPPAPVLSGSQRALLALLARLQRVSFPHLLDNFMSRSELFILRECNVQNIQPVTRLYLAVCKLTRNLDRMRRMACDALYFLGDLSIPFLFTVLSTWIEVLPLQQDGLDNPLVKVLIQVVNLKTCVNPGYNLLPLKKLLHDYFGYPTERWNSDDLFKDIFNNFAVKPNKFLEYCLLILCKNHPWKWTSAQIDIHLKPILESNCSNSLTSRKTILSLVKNLTAGVEEDIADLNIKYDD